jgi:hypothetical protein
MLTNNDIMKKLRVALKLRDTDIIDILKKADFDITSSELGAIFRTEDHPNYKECGDQLLRNFLNGLIVHLRGPMPDKPEKPVKADKPEGASKPKQFSTKPFRKDSGSGKQLKGPPKKF